MTLATAFTASAEKHLGKTALFWGEAEHSYGSLLSQARHLAAHLQQHLGLKPGHRVGLWLKNCPEFVPALFGVLLAGGVVVPINNFLKPDEINHILDDAGIDFLITDASMAESWPRLLAVRPGLKFWSIEEFTRLPAMMVDSRFTIHYSRPTDLAVIIYTSGTT